MSKRKILTLALSICMIAILAIGGTLAYFTDTTETKTNVFTVGDVQIDLIEEFDGDENDDGTALLMPGTKTQNAVNKDVWVENTGDHDAWVRVKISVPSNLDVLAREPENYEEIAAQNILHWNIVAGNETIWNVEKASWEAELSEDKEYNVYTFYYNEVLPAGETTEQLLEQVYLDSNVDYDGTNYTCKGKVVDLSDIKILVVAEAIQSTGFDTYEAAFAAYDAQVK